jgi:hypothetical protein
MHRIINDNLADLVKICEKYDVSRLYIFGSALTEKFSPEQSDLDFLVEMQPLDVFERGEKLIQLWDALENLFQKKIDLITDQPIKNAFFKAEVDRTKQLLYDRTKQEIPV